METAPLYSDIAEGPEGGAAWWLRTQDGVRIRLGYWAHEAPRGTVFLFPGRTEYIEKYGLMASELAEHGYAMLAIDWRGQGLADRALDDKMKGHIGDFSEYQHDVEAVMEAAKTLDLPRPWHLIGHSMGGCIGLRAMMNGIDVESAGFSAPMWGLVVTPIMRPLAWAVTEIAHRLRFGHCYLPGTVPETYVNVAAFEGNNLTSDLEMYDYMRSQVAQHPELKLGGPTMTWVNKALRETRALAALPAPDYPTYTALGTAEVIVDPNRIKTRMNNWPNGKLEIFEGARHEVLMEGKDVRAQFLNGCVRMFEIGGNDATQSV